MQGRTPHQSAEAMANQVQQAANLTDAVAILWTWLEKRLGEFGSLGLNIPELCDVARKRPFVSINAVEVKRLREEPLVGAAELLARVARHLRSYNGGVATASRARGFNRAQVIVVWKRPDLAKRVGGGDEAPAAMEHPSLEALAPCLAVSPVKLNRILLEIARPTGIEWTASSLLLEAGMGEPPTLSVHLDPLEHHGLTGWTQEGRPPVGWFDEAKINEADEARCVSAVKAAVAAASGPPAILVMPELAATPAVHDALRDALRNAPKKRDKQPPALSVIGLYHIPYSGGVVAPELRGTIAEAGHVNEAVVLGPRGGELWRHRKLSKAYAKAKPAKGKKPSVPAVPEDTVLGTSLTIVPTPVGLMAIAICLDSFQKRSRERLERSGADVVLVPSLSPSVERHRTSLRQLAQSLWGATFVVNRGLLDGHPTQDLWNSKGARSFWAFQRCKVKVPASWKAPDHPSFVFRA